MKRIIPLNPTLLSDRNLIVEQKKRIVNLSNRLQRLEELFQRNTPSQKISFSTLDAVHYYNKKDILYFKAEGSYTTLYTIDNAKLVISQTLKQIANSLTDNNFLRIHQSFLINVNHIKKHIKKDQKVILENNATLPISRTNKNIFDNINL